MEFEYNHGKAAKWYQGWPQEQRDQWVMGQTQQTSFLCFFNWEDNPITKGIAISNINESIYPSIFCLYNLGLPGGSQLSQGKGGVYPGQVASLSHDTHSHIHTYSQFIFTSDPNPVETSASAEFL